MQNTKTMALFSFKKIRGSTYYKHDAEWFKEQVQGFWDEILITDDHTEVGDMIARIEPSAIFGTQSNPRV